MNSIWCGWPRADDRTAAEVSINQKAKETTIAILPQPVSMFLTIEQRVEIISLFEPEGATNRSVAETFNTKHSELPNRVFDNFQHRLNLCVAVGGRHFEHLWPSGSIVWFSWLHYICYNYAFFSFESHCSTVLFQILVRDFMATLYMYTLISV